LAKAKPEAPRPHETVRSSLRLLSFVYLGSFLADWADLGLGEPDLEALERAIMGRPEAGVVVSGTGGLRKLRFARTKSNKGKSGSERVCYALFPRPGLVLMVTVFGKDDKDNLSAAERSAVKAMLIRYEARLGKKEDGT
jgi:hypothetical protein